MKPFQVPPGPKSFKMDDDSVVVESFFMYPKIGLAPLPSMAPWASMPGATRREKRKAYFSLKQKDRPK